MTDFLRRCRSAATCFPVTRKRNAALLVRPSAVDGCRSHERFRANFENGRRPAPYAQVAYPRLYTVLYSSRRAVRVLKRVDYPDTAFDFQKQNTTRAYTTTYLPRVSPVNVERI